MSIFASHQLKTIPLPMDPPHEITIKKLNGRQYEKARTVYTDHLFEGMRARGGAAVQRDMMELFKDLPTATAQIAEQKADPLNGFDPYTILLYGIKAWTYDVPVSPEAIEDLSVEVLEFLAPEILRHTKPALFETADEQTESRKNASGSWPTASTV